MADILALSSAQRNYLRKHAHHLKPVVMIGSRGMAESVVQACDEALNDHELIKVKFQDYKEDRREISEELAQNLNAYMVGIIGNILILFRHAPEPEDRHYKLPAG